VTAPNEELLQQIMKIKSLAFSSLQCTIARQESHLLWLKKGDAPTKFFHVHANSWRRRNFIRSVERDGQVLVTEDSKAQAFFEFFDTVMGTLLSWRCAINLNHLGLLCLVLSQLGERFTKEELWAIIKSLSPDKAPCPDCFTARFLLVAWPVI
jgi:hypothetical protein